MGADVTRVPDDPHAGVVLLGLSGALGIRGRDDRDLVGRIHAEEGAVEEAAGDPISQDRGAER